MQTWIKHFIFLYMWISMSSLSIEKSAFDSVHKEICNHPISYHGLSGQFGAYRPMQMQEDSGKPAALFDCKNCSGGNLLFSGAICCALLCESLRSK